MTDTADDDVEPIPHADRITDLSDIDNLIASLPHHAGLAVQSLTGRPLSTSSHDPTNSNFEQGSSPNLDSTNAPTTTNGPSTATDPTTVSGTQTSNIPNPDLIPTLSSSEIQSTFSEHNRTYLHTLQGIQARLRRQAYALEEAGIVAAKGAKTSRDQIGTVGGFDVGWLNSRRDEVGWRKEGELWREAKEMLEGLDEEPMEL
ncbi:MAG: hypothetical protein Q9162_003565 [Coniocarpon cinnabarinum]